MNTTAATPDCAGHRFPLAITAHAIWLSCRFALSFRDMEMLLTERGVIATYESPRRW